MKRRLLLLVHIALIVISLPAQDAGWERDAAKADAFFYAGDFDAAWLFYERAMIAGVDDAKVLFRAAETFNRQQLVENPELQTALYATAHHLLMVQYPDDPVVDMAADRTDSSVTVNRRYLRRTFGMVGAKAPRTRPGITDGFLSRISEYASARMDDLATFFSLLLTEGPRDAFGWARNGIWNLLIAYFMLALIPGIILPVVMAVTVAREGRKSYVTAYLFLIFWGPLGIHRFYMGRFAGGIIWLLTGGLAGLGVFFDIFLTGAYIRFWNEDHRDGRPSGSGPGSGAGVSRRISPAGKTGTAKPKKVRAAKNTGTPKTRKPPRTPKPKKEKKSRSTAGSAAAAASGAAIGAAAADISANPAEGDALPDFVSDNDFSIDSLDMDDLSPAEAADVPVVDDDFGDIPDLDLGGDDFSIPDTGNGGGDEDEFDLGSLD